MSAPVFLAGVVEGFYGQPWTHRERLELLELLQQHDLNTYFYAPKDDLKHRAVWREMYADGELALLAELVDQCGRRGIEFIYGLSPGLDVRFSDDSELDAVKRRFGQLRNVGVRHFALLFDDLPGEINEQDRAQFDSVAAAQCFVANRTFDWLRGDDAAARLLFCPTPYCDRMDREQHGGAGYLDAVGRELAAGIDVLWTGPEIVSREIPVESIKQLTDRIGRPPVIWDNLFANDYDWRRLNCGPYSGRSAELREHVRGILVNPNNEFAINYVPLRTFGRYLAEAAEYEPRAAYLAGVEDWLTRYETVRRSIARESLLLMTDCYYLPHEEGAEATRLYELVARLLRTPVNAWGGDFAEFMRLHDCVQQTFENLTELVDRRLFYAWSRRAWELKEELDLLRQVLEHKEAGGDLAGGVAVGSHLPDTYRGGLVARLQRLLVQRHDGTFTPGETV